MKTKAKTIAPTAAAQRMRRYRDRLKRGKCILPVEADKGQVADQLVDLGSLEEWDSESLTAIGNAILQLAGKKQFGA